MIKTLKRVVQSFDKRRKFFRGLPSDAVVLELGCGSGENCILLRSMHPDVKLYGVDVIQDPEIPDSVHFARVDLNRESLPFKDEFFDVVIFTHVIEHLSAPQLVGNEIQRVLKSGGRIYLETPNWTSMFVPSFGFRREQHSPFNFFDDPTHVKPWTRHGVYEFLSQNCGLHVERVGTVRNWVRIPLDPLMMIGGLLSGKRRVVISSFWNLFGWSIFGIGSRR